ncbi:ATP synthase F1 subunit delta [uncultured Limosilactobacillus sp.]|uniref:ATP synthase F1 subunit delta n=1 Tax=uncultured Limosilactobacillus sp. TaxID=2837629 RepID=UPI0025CFA4D4|nr:ATP synthase F1 subunit delta [uncultured Limosilactobacillus sp.]
MSLDKKTVAKRYAKALFELVDANDQLEQTYQELVALRTVFKQNAGLQRALSGTNLSQDQKETIINELKNGASQLVTNLIQMVFDYGRMDEMVAIIDEFETQYDQAHKRVHADVVSAVQLDEKRRQKLAETLAHRLGANDVILNETVDSQIIGGLIVKVGSQTLDGSLKTKLEKMRRILVN